MGPPPWTYKNKSRNIDEAGWLKKYILDNYDVKTGLQGLKTGALEDFPLRFGRERRMINGVLETDAEMEKRYKLQPEVSFLKFYSTENENTECFSVAYL